MSFSVFCMYSCIVSNAWGIEDTDYFSLSFLSFPFSVFLLVEWCRLILSVRAKPALEQHPGGGLSILVWGGYLRGSLIFLLTGCISGVVMGLWYYFTISGSVGRYHSATFFLSCLPLSSFSVQIYSHVGRAYMGTIQSVDLFVFLLSEF